MKITLSSLIIVLLLLLLSCGDSKQKDAIVPTEDLDSVEIELPTPWEDVPLFEGPEINYSLVEIRSNQHLKEIRERFGNDSEQGKAYRKALRTLNRKELRHMRVGESIIVPDTFLLDMRAYSFFPVEYTGACYLPKIIVIDNEYQAYGCYEYGRLVRFAAVNSGKERTPTFPGRYSLVWKQRLRLSSLDSTWKMPWTFNFHQWAGNAMHQFDMPGRPVSHSCIRQFEDDAEWIFGWGKQADYDTNRQTIPHSGTPVLILNVFDYERPKGGPWLELKSNKDYFIDLPEHPMEVEEALIPWCQIPKSSRGVIPNKERYYSAEDTLRKRGIIREGVVLIPTNDFNLERRLKKAAKEKEEQRKNNAAEPDDDIIPKTFIEEEKTDTKTEVNTLEI